LASQSGIWVTKWALRASLLIGGGSYNGAVLAM
jgi:hypothetical protein